MKSVFPPSFFEQNRARLAKTARCDLIVIAGFGVLQQTGTDTHKFIQNSNLWYLTGAEVPDSFLVIDTHKTYICVPEREVGIEKFEGGHSRSEVKKQAGVDEVISTEAGWERLKKRLKTVKTLGTLEPAPAFIERYDFYTNPAPRRVFERLLELASKAKVKDLKLALARQRMIKQDLELAVLQRAIDITVETLREVLPRPFNHEYELEAAIHEGFRRRGANGNAFTSIVASGANAATPHYMINNDTIDKSGLTVIDVGAEVNHYAADISRTFTPVIASSRQQAVYDAVLDTYEWAKTQLKPGVLYKDYEENVTQYLAKHMKRLKIITKMDTQSIRQFYPHYASHSLGLDTHDAADYDMPLQPNMVFTIEPGLYLPEEGIGVRIEDDVLITKSGVKVLSDELPRSLSF